MFMFTIDKYGSEKQAILAFKIVRPYNHDEVASKVEDYLKAAFSWLIFESAQLHKKSFLGHVFLLCDRVIDLMPQKNNASQGLKM